MAMRRLWRRRDWKPSIRMIDMVIVIIILALICLLYLLSTMGRRNHPALERFRGWSYAHRGLHGNGCPENSMAAFEKALNAGYGIELDIHLLADGNLAVMHDSALKRTTGAEGKIEDLTTEQLQNYRLGDSEETIPEFRQVLELFQGKAPLIVELKPVGGNHAALCETACAMLDSYQGDYCMESFDPRCIYWLKKHRPEILRGQLTENYFKTNSTLSAPLKFLLRHQMENFLVMPDFVAYRCSDRKTLSNFLVRKIWGVQGVTWTLKTQEEYDAAVKEGWIPIFEGFEP